MQGVSCKSLLLHTALQQPQVSSTALKEKAVNSFKLDSAVPVTIDRTGSK